MNEELEKTREDEIKGIKWFSVNEILYLAWFVSFFVLTDFICGFGIAFLLHGTGVLFAYVCGEPLFRLISGWRELRTNREKEKLLPVLDATLDFLKPAIKEKIEGKIELFILDDLSINAAALGRYSIMITKGALLQLSDEQIIALLLHELGHIKNNDTYISLLFECFNWPWMVIFKVIDRVTVYVDNNRFLYGSSPQSILWSPFKWFSIIVQNLISLIFAYSKRRQEYKADNFVSECGCGEGLISLLYELDMLSNTEPRKIQQYLMATHPPMTKRIQKLEEGYEIEKPSRSIVLKSLSDLFH